MRLLIVLLLVSSCSVFKVKDKNRFENVNAEILPYVKTFEWYKKDDVRALTMEALNHRILLKPEAELEGLDVKAIIKNIIEEIPVPI